MSAAVALPRLDADSAVPHRDELLDPTAVRPILEQTLERSLTAVEIARVKYRVGHSLRVHYRATGGDTTWSVTIRTAAAQREPRPDARRWDEFGAYAWVFPCDRKITGLADIVQRSTDLGGVISAADELVLEAYAPEKAATFRVTDRRTTDRFVKVMEPRAFRGAVRRAAVLPSLLAAASIPTPQLIACRDATGTLAWTQLHGRAATVSPSDCHAVGRVLARLHSIAPPAMPDHRRTGHEALAEAATTISAVRADLADIATALSETLRAQRPSSAERCLLHGDVHPKNVLVDGDVAGLIDLDQAVVGPGVADVASLLAKLDEMHAPEESGAALIAGYEDAGGVLDADDVRWHRAASTLTERAVRAITRCRAGVLIDLEDHLAGAHDTIRSSP